MSKAALGIVIEFLLIERIIFRFYILRISTKPKSNTLIFVFVLFLKSKKKAQFNLLIFFLCFPKERLNLIYKTKEGGKDNLKNYLKVILFVVIKERKVNKK